MKFQNPFKKRNEAKEQAFKNLYSDIEQLAIGNDALRRGFKAVIECVQARSGLEHVQAFLNDNSIPRVKIGRLCMSGQVVSAVRDMMQIDKCAIEIAPANGPGDVLYVCSTGFTPDAGKAYMVNALDAVVEAYAVVYGTRVHLLGFEYYTKLLDDMTASAEYTGYKPSLTLERRIPILEEDLKKGGNLTPILCEQCPPVVLDMAEAGRLGIETLRNMYANVVYIKDPNDSRRAFAINTAHLMGPNPYPEWLVKAWNDPMYVMQDVRFPVFKPETPDANGDIVDVPVKIEVKDEPKD